MLKEKPTIIKTIIFFSIILTLLCYMFCLFYLTPSLNEDSMTFIRAEDLCIGDKTYLVNTTLDDYNCSKISIMIKTNYYPAITEHIGTYDCNGHNITNYRTYYTAHCNECAKNRYIQKYFNECI